MNHNVWRLWDGSSILIRFIIAVPLYSYNFMLLKLLVLVMNFWRFLKSWFMTNYWSVWLMDAKTNGIFQHRYGGIGLDYVRNLTRKQSVRLFPCKHIENINERHGIIKTISWISNRNGTFSCISNDVHKSSLCIGGKCVIFRERRQPRACANNWLVTGWLCDSCYVGVS